MALEPIDTFKEVLQKTKKPLVVLPQHPNGDSICLCLGYRFIFGREGNSFDGGGGFIHMTKRHGLDFCLLRQMLFLLSPDPKTSFLFLTQQTIPFQMSVPTDVRMNLVPLTPKKTGCRFRGTSLLFGGIEIRSHYHIGMC